MPLWAFFFRGFSKRRLDRIVHEITDACYPTVASRITGRVRGMTHPEARGYARVWAAELVQEAIAGSGAAGHNPQICQQVFTQATEAVVDAAVVTAFAAIETARPVRAA